MDINHEVEKKLLEKKITELSAALAKASRDGGKALKEALIHIHHPGWTTPAELAFAKTIINGLFIQVQNVQGQIDGFQKAAGIVEKK